MLDAYGRAISLLILVIDDIIVAVTRAVGWCIAVVIGVFAEHASALSFSGSPAILFRTSAVRCTGLLRTLPHLQNQIMMGWSASLSASFVDKVVFWSISFWGEQPPDNHMLGWSSQTVFICCRQDTAFE